MLTRWLRLVLRDGPLISQLYHSWSYAATTGFDDALQRLEQLTNLHFELPD